MDKIIIGSRGSKLALTQSNWVAAQLRAATPGLEVSIVEIKTTGDRNLGASLSELGGKGAFTKELEDALLDGRCDLAVHSMKDLPTQLPDGLGVVCTPAREDTRDVIILREAPRDANLPLGFLPHGFRVGSSSLRRRAQLHALRPDLRVLEFRGNVDSRLRKLAEGEVDACILAAAGVRRLGLLHEGTMRIDGLHFRYLEAPQWLPAVGQGALAIEGRRQNGVPTEWMAQLNDGATFSATVCERAFLNRLGAGCQAPVGALAQVTPGGGIQMDVAIYSRDGATCVRHSGMGDPDRAGKLGLQLANWCLENGAQGLVSG